MGGYKWESGEPIVSWIFSNVGDKCNEIVEHNKTSYK